MENDLYILATLIAAAHNPHVHFDLVGMPEVEQNVYISDLEKEMKLLLDTKVFDDCLKRIGKMKFASFDLEIANDFPEDGEWSTELGISCLAVALSDRKDVIYSWDVPYIDKDEARGNVEMFMDFVSQGYKIVTWNGTKFDFRVLADASGMYKECAELAMGHLDMMLWVTFQKGYYLGLDAALKGMGCKGKKHEVTLKDGTALTEMSGAKAPELWRAGETDAVLAYLEDDVLQPLELVQKIETLKRISWTSKKGNWQTVLVPELWTVEECFKLLEPDTSWMKRSNPLKRDDFISWMK